MQSTKTRPAPSAALRGPRAARTDHAAPPPTTRQSPKRPLCEFARAATCTPELTPRVDQNERGRARGTASSATGPAGGIDPVAGMQAGLVAEERDGEVGTDAFDVSDPGAAVRVEAARQVKRDDAPACSLIHCAAARNSPCSGRARPMPNSASTTMSKRRSGRAASTSCLRHRATAGRARAHRPPKAAMAPMSTQTLGAARGSWPRRRSRRHRCCRVRRRCRRMRRSPARASNPPPRAAAGAHHQFAGGKAGLGELCSIARSSATVKSGVPMRTG